MIRALAVLLFFVAGATSALAQITFTITGSDASKTVTVTATGTVTSPTTYNLSSTETSWNSYGDLWKFSSGQALNLTSGITITNTTLSNSSPVAYLRFLNTVAGDGFGFSNQGFQQINATNDLMISGTATFTLPVSFDFSDYFGAYGTYTSTDSKNPFGTGPTVILNAPAVPEPSTYAALFGAAALLVTTSARRRRTLA